MPFLTRFISFALLSGIALSPTLWFFPRAIAPTPLISGFPNGVSEIISALFVCSIILTIFKPKIIFPTILFAGLSVLGDLNRLQPWLYQYVAMLFAVATFQDKEAKRACQLILFCVYFWSGFYKLNIYYYTSTLPWLFKPVSNLSIGVPLSFAALFAPLVEIIFPFLLLAASKRKLGVILGALMHIILLMLLVMHQWNSVVWPWNVAMIVFLFLLFWNEEERLFTLYKSKGSYVYATIVLLFLVAPWLHIFQLWNPYLSFALYSRTIPEVEFEFSKKTATELHTNQTKLKGITYFLEHLNVPPFPAKSVLFAAGVDFCNRFKNDPDIRVKFNHQRSWMRMDIETEVKSCGELSS